MLNSDILEDCLIELPPYGSFPVKGFRKVNEPVRIHEPDAWIHEDGDRRREPVGLVFTVADGQQVFLPIEGKFAYHQACHLLNPSPDLRSPDADSNSQPYSKLGPKGDVVTREVQEWLRFVSEAPRGSDALPKASLA